MKSTYSVTEAQAALPALLRKSTDELITITRHEKPIAYVVSAERMAALAETLEIMADSAAMRAIRTARQGRGRYSPMSALDED